jgi:hypothetical protein
MTKTGSFIIGKEKYAIAQSSKTIKGAFANVVDKNEITVIIEQDKVGKWAKKVEKDFKLITFDMALPFGMTGFISRVLTALAKQKIPIFVISAFTTDHILIKEKYVIKAEKALTKLGFKRK